MNILVIGGTRYAGRRFVQRMLDQGHCLTIVARGRTPDPFGSAVERIVCERRMLWQSPLLENRTWDVAVDQVCFDVGDALSATKALNGRVGRYIVTSSQSVYDAGSNIAEESFKPQDHVFSAVADKFEDYNEAKRQMEATIARTATMPWITLRVPLIMANDDSSGRLQWHLQRIMDGQPIMLPNPSAAISMIHADDMSAVLDHLTQADHAGPINAASIEPIAIGEFIHALGEKLGRDPVITDSSDGDAHSPYGIGEDWWMNVTALSASGCTLRPIRQWLPTLVQH
jgi:nucleoside-diphosphate-sugar epimerase